MERIQPPLPRIEGDAEERSPKSRDPARLAPMIAQARTLPPAEQKVAADDINALLIAMREPGNESAEARAVLAQLELHTLDGLRDSEDRSCRAEAVATLVACGFPHALNVTPGELEDLIKESSLPPLKQARVVGMLIAVGVPIAVAVLLRSAVPDLHLRGLFGVLAAGGVLFLLANFWPSFRRRRPKW